MKSELKIPVKRFLDAFSKVGWNIQDSKHGEYIIWADPKNSEIWTRLPKSTEALDYKIYQEKNILMLLYALGIEESESSISDMLTQLDAYNYKLMNRIIGSKNNKIDAVPYELATMLPEKNISAFRYFYQTKRRSKSLPIERFQFNHTQVGSFVIPISIVAEDEGFENTRLMPVASETNIILHQYLDAIETLTKIPRKSAIEFADKVIAESIDSKIVKDFLGTTDSIAKYKDKYREQVSRMTIGSKGSALLDFGLKEEEKEFNEVDLGTIEMLSSDFVETLERRELESDDSRIDEHEVKMDVIVEAIDLNGHVKFAVTAINGEELKKTFKATTNELPKAKLDQFADLFKNSGLAVISGDVTKSKGKMGKIRVDNLGEKSSKDLNIKFL